MGRHKRREVPSRRTAGRKAGVAALMAAGVLLGGGSWQSASAVTQPHGCGDQEEEEPPPPSHGANYGLVFVDNSNADSWLEVDRTLNTMVSSKGTAGSDHDGDGGDVDVSREPPGAPGTPQAAGQPSPSEGDD